MSQLIQQLRNEHAELSSALAEIGKFGVTTIEGQRLLANAKASLLNHLQKEDEYLYPILRQAAKGNYALQEKLDTYAEEMEQVSQTVMEFFEKHQGGDQANDFEADFRKVYLALTKRIISEESKLFPEYDRIRAPL